MGLNVIGDLTGDCMTWVLANSGDLSSNFSVRYTDELVNSIRFINSDTLVNFVGSGTDIAGEKINPLFSLSEQFPTFYGFYGYERSDGSLNGFGSISIGR